MKIAIIGSGIAGLTAAYRIHRDRIGEVTLLDGQPRAGIDAHRVEINHQGHQVTVDVPSRMFNDAQWPNLTRLYDEIGVRYVPVNASQSFSVIEERKHDGEPYSYLRNDDATRPGQMTSQMLSRTGRRIRLQAMKFFRVGTSDLHAGSDHPSSQQTLGDYLRRHDFSDDFVYRFLYPTLASTVCTCQYASLDSYPAHTVLRTLSNLVRPGKLQRTRLGTADVARRLLRGKIRVLHNTRVDSVAVQVNERDNASSARSDSCESDGVEVRLDDGRRLLFDHVVLATQADTALSLLENPDARQRAILGSIRYDNVSVCVHDDPRLMPKRKSHWSTFNMLTEPSHQAASCTVWLNRFYGNWKFRHPVFQTIGDVGTIDPAKVVRSTKLCRSVVNFQSLAALDQLDQWHAEPGRRIWFCGSWASRGVPLLESAVVSAEKVSESIKAGIDRLSRVQSN
tara:strand:+ start:40716 stop:42071 length:1356 start_codon:yes stop_codon:yes gene_type:complete